MSEHAPELDKSPRADTAKQSSADVLENKIERLDSESAKLGSVTLAKIRLGIPVDGPLEDEDKPKRTPEAKAAKRGRRVNRRGGRSVNEGNDSEHDPNWNAEGGEITDEDSQRAHVGAESVRRVLDKLKPHEPTEDDIRARRAAEVAEIRRKSRESWGDSI